MSCLISPLLPDELIFSLPGRVLKKYPSLRASGIREIFGGTCFPTSKAFPCRLAIVAQALKYEGAPSATECARAHTFLPFAQPLLSRENTDRLIASMVESSHRAKAPVFLTHASSANVLFLRACPLCIEDDLAAFGTAYWHRLHQVPILTVCHKHHISLTETRVSWAQDRDFPLVDESIMSSNHAVTSASPIQKMLCAGYESLANYPHPIPERSQVFQTLTSMLKDAGVLDEVGAPEGLVARALFSKFGAAALAELNIPNEQAFYPYARSVLFRPKDKVTPLEAFHIILLSALTGSPFDSVLENARSSPASTGPWICVSVGNPCSGQARIQAKVRATYQKLPAARFVCPDCGTSYFRKLPLDQKSDGAFEFTLKTKRNAPMPIWSNKLALLWPDPDQTWDSLEKAVGETRPVLRRIAAKLGLPDMPGRVLRCMRSVVIPRSKDWKSRRAKKKAVLATFLQEYPNATRSTLQKHDPNLYAWLCNNAPELLNELPKKLRHERALAKKHTSFEEYDRSCAALINRLGPAARDQLQTTQRIVSMNSLLKIIDPAKSIDLHGRCRPSLTLAALSKFVETPEQHFERLFAAMRRNLSSGDRPVRLADALRQHHLYPYYSNRADFRERIRQVFYQDSRKPCAVTETLCQHAELN